MNYYPRYPAQYMAKTVHLTMEQDGAYTRLLDWAYSNERPIPHEQRFAIARATKNSEKKAVNSVLNEFFFRTESGWENDRANKELDEAAPRIEAARRNGFKGGRPRKEKPSGFPEQNPVGSYSETQKEPSTKALDSRLSNTLTERSTHTPESASPLGAVDVFEDHDVPRATPNPVAPLAIALNAKGVRCTAMNPDLIAAHAEGVTPEHLTALTELPEFQGKPATYVIRAARREHAERAAPISTGPPRQQPMGKTATAIAILEQSKRERQQQRLADGRDRDGNPEAPVLIARSHTGS